MEEIWKPIPRCDGYEASSLGRIRNTKTKKIFDGYLNTKGYFRVSVIQDGERKNMAVHKLVARAFHGEPTAPMTLHKDGVKTNNTPENLYYGTALDNAADSLKHKTHAHGEKHGRSLLTEEQVIAIKKEYAEGKTTCKLLAEKYGVNTSTIWLIKSGINWSWVAIDAAQNHINGGTNE